MTRSRSDIRSDVHKAESDRRDEMRRAMKEYDMTTYWPLLRKLRGECGELGHNWRFESFGPTWMSWYRCGICGKAEARDE